MTETPFREYREDGWPFCPSCGEDELYSLLYWDGQGQRPPLEEYVKAGMACYCCDFELEPTR